MSWNPRMEERCKVVADRAFEGLKYTARYAPGDFASSPAGFDKCIVDFKHEGVTGNIADSVDCEERCYEKCVGWTLEEYKADEECVRGCITDCEREIEDWTKGSVIFSPRNESIMESSLPLPYWTLGEEWYGDSESGKEDRSAAMKILRLFRPLGCEAGDFGWHHVHEFIDNPEEEREPDVMFMHVSAPEPGKCNVGRVMRLYKKVVEEGYRSPQRGLAEWVE